MNRPSDTSIPPHLTSPEERSPSASPRQGDLDAPQTQVVADRDAYLGQGRHDVGRRISDDQVELFISGDLAQSLQQEFSRHAPEFIALHDVGTSASLRLLASMANPAGARVQRCRCAARGMAWRWPCCSSSKCLWPTVRPCASIPPTSTPTPPCAPRWHAFCWRTAGWVC
jgi:hypothetical protein